MLIIKKYNRVWLLLYSLGLFQHCGAVQVYQNFRAPTQKWAPSTVFTWMQNSF